MTHLVAYLTTAVVFLVVDAIWLGLVARDFYASRLGDMMKSPVDLKIAAGFYAVYVIGIVIFAVAPALAADAWRTALVKGALFGFFAYATYDLTNLATLEGWPVTVTVVDVVWGTGLTAGSALMGFILTKRLMGAG
ncbi:MAG: DUF2177 family protein [Alphaproteobacteria bacterium]